MFDLVLWSFVIALTPLALGLAWKLICGVGRFIDFGSSRALEAAAEQRELTDFRDFDLSSNPSLVSGSSWY